jgi:hypothetical protein
MHTYSAIFSLLAQFLSFRFLEFFAVYLIKGVVVDGLAGLGVLVVNFLVLV